MSVEENVKRILREKGIEFKEYEHEPVYTCEQAAKARGLESKKEGVKAMVFKSGENFILILNPSNKKIDTKKIAALEGVKHISLAKLDEVERVTGVLPGAVPPFGLETRLKTYLNQEILENEHVYFNCGSHEHSIRIRGKDLARAVGECVIFR